MTRRNGQMRAAAADAASYSPTPPRGAAAAAAAPAWSQSLTHHAHTQQSIVTARAPSISIRIVFRRACPTTVYHRRRHDGWTDLSLLRKKNSRPGHMPYRRNDRLCRLTRTDKSWEKRAKFCFLPITQYRRASSALRRRPTGSLRSRLPKRARHRITETAIVRFT